MGSNPLVQFDPGLFVWTILTFIVLLVLLAKFAWKPLLAALDHREKVIAGAVDDSARLLADGRREAESIIARARTDAERFREELRQQATTEAQAITRNAQSQIQHETARAIAQIRGEAVDLSLAIASKILRRTVTVDDQQRLVDEVVANLEKH